MDIRTLCRKIQMPQPMAEHVFFAYAALDWNVLAEALKHLVTADTGLQGFGELSQLLGEDLLGASQLACQLHCACLCFETYRQLGIPEQVYFDTMSCFSRFVTECLYYKGGYQFDRGWWTWRQLSLTVFRLGQLEYELRSDDTVAVHIPTGADLSPKAVDESFAAARAFLRRFFPRYAAARFTCNSWLLSPALPELLEDDSNILRFRQRFTLSSADSEAVDYISWLFQQLPGVKFEKLSERTSLQRRAKEYLLNGGKIGSAAGYIDFMEA